MVDFVMNIIMSNSFMVDGWVMLGMIVCMVGIITVCTFFPENLEVELVFSVTKPVVSHVPGLCFLYCDVVVGKSLGCSIICLDRGGRLWMTHLY